jgi:multidrug efflux pump subunit AcrA (membrane-fusion protein)
MLQNGAKSGVSKRVLAVFIRVVLCAVLVAGGIYGMLTLASMKKSPEEAPAVKERRLKVEVVSVTSVEVPVAITGYGEATAVDVVSIAPEVSGKVVLVHPGLEVGGLIPKGEVLFKIDDKDYASAVKEEESSVSLWENGIRRLQKQSELDWARLITLERNCELAKAEFERVKRLFEDDKVGTRSGVDSAEQTYNRARDQADQMRQTLELYPIQIGEVENNHNGALARLSIARTRLERCVVRSPFSARVKAVSMEVGQYVTTGQNVLTLADDSILEIHVPLDSQDVRRWLQFIENTSQNDTAWFARPKPVECRIGWTEDRVGHVWKGNLHHVVKFDQQTRTVTVAVRIEARDALSTSEQKLPLVEGMFCSVEIPGQTMHNVFQIPRWAVSFNSTVYVAEQNRLKTVPVTVARIEGEQAYISAGLNEGDLVVTTRLTDPLENSLLEIVNPKTDGSHS